MGSLSHKQTIIHIQNCDIFVVPSIWQEPLGLTVLEGMSAGKPVVTSKRGGIPEVIGDCGILLDPENSLEFCDKLVELIENYDLRKNLSERAKTRAVTYFSWDKVAKECDKLYQN